jgi:cell division transport system permease protein
MLGLLGLLVIDAKKITEYVKEHVQLNVILKNEISEAEVAGFLNEIKGYPFVRTSKYISKEEALDSLKRELGDDALGMLESNPLPSTVDIGITADYAVNDSLIKIKELLRNKASVIEVSYQQHEVDKMNKNFRTMAIFILVFCGILFFVAIVLINNTIRLSLYSKRFLIKSMQLVGATKRFIRWPFLKKGLIHGFIAGLIGILLLSGILFIIQKRFPEFGQLSDLKIIALLFSSILVFGFLLSGLSTFFAINRHLGSNTDDLH